MLDRAILASLLATLASRNIQDMARLVAKPEVAADRVSGEEELATAAVTATIVTNRHCQLQGFDLLRLERFGSSLA